MATIDKMLAAAPLSESEVVAMVESPRLDYEVIEYANKKGVSIDSQVILTLKYKSESVRLKGSWNHETILNHFIGRTWQVTLNGFNVSRFDLNNEDIPLESHIKNIKDMINILASKPKKPKVGDMARQTARKFEKFSYVGMWDTGHPGVQIGAKWFERVIHLGFGQTKTERFYLEGYFVNGQHFKDFGMACAVADYYLEYVRGGL